MPIVGVTARGENPLMPTDTQAAALVADLNQAAVGAPGLQGEAGARCGSLIALCACRRILQLMTGVRTRVSRRRAVTSLLVLAPLIVLGTGAGFATLESDTVSSYWEGLWWALSLMTTVGFVGESPETTGCWAPPAC